MPPFSLESHPKEIEGKAKILVEKATDPNQYDSLDFGWEKEGMEDSPTRRFFREYLEEYLGNLTGKSVIDIGSGIGHFSEMFRELGADEVEGIEPSHKNAEISRKLYPDMPVEEKTLEKAEPKKTFDVAAVVMAFEHIRDLDSAFRKVAKFLKPRGYFYLIVGDKQYGTAERFGYTLEIEDIGNDEVAVATKRPYGQMHDIFRPTDNFIDSAQKAGFSFKKAVPLTPTEKLIEAEPKYKEFEETPLNHLLIFKYTGISDD